VISQLGSLPIIHPDPDPESKLHPKILSELNSEEKYENWSAFAEVIVKKDTPGRTTQNERHFNE